MLKIGILGVGVIGSTIAAAIDRKQVDAELVALADQDHPRAEALSAELTNHPAVVSTDEMIERSDLAVEAASQAALGEFVPKALGRGRDMLIMSAGGLLGHEAWFRVAHEQGCRIYIPSGAIAGLDGIKSASMGRIESAMLISRKPVAALKQSKYVMERDLPLDSTGKLPSSSRDSPRKRLSPSRRPRTWRLRCAWRLTLPVRSPCASESSLCRAEMKTCMRFASRVNSAGSL
jgi:aspartate dehydrogenase